MSSNLTRGSKNMSMKIDIAKVKQIPKEASSSFGVGVYGDLNEELMSWVDAHGFATEKVGPYTNILINKDLNEVFEKANTEFYYIDGFSPNLNKHLHLGHFANLVLAKSFVAMGVAKKTVAILGDTLTGEVGKEEAFKKYMWYCNTFDYKVNKLYFASEMKDADNLLENGTGEYEGTMIFNVNGNKVVGKKSDGSTTYFYQDVALANKLTSPTLYLTGHEQNQHFANLKVMFPWTHHVGLGLVKAGNVKMSSRVGNVIMADDLLDEVLSKFNGDAKLAYNVIAGHILKAAPTSDKKIDVAALDNPLNSKGLYLSYTLAKMKSAGIVVAEQSKFNSLKLQFKLLKAQQMLSPNILFDELVEHAKYMSTLYITHKIKDNAENKIMFTGLTSDLAFGLKMLGLFEVDKV